MVLLTSGMRSQAFEEMVQCHQRCNQTGDHMKNQLSSQIKQRDGDMNVTEIKEMIMISVES